MEKPRFLYAGLYCTHTTLSKGVTRLVSLIVFGSPVKQYNMYWQKHIKMASLMLTTRDEDLKAQWVSGNNFLYLYLHCIQVIWYWLVAVYFAAYRRTDDSVNYAWGSSKRLPYIPCTYDKSRVHNVFPKAGKKKITINKLVLELRSDSRPLR